MTKNHFIGNTYRIIYRNWQNKIEPRIIQNKNLEVKVSQWHSSNNDKQLIIHALDKEKCKMREFRANDIIKWE